MRGKITTLELGETVQPIKYSPFKHQNLNLVPYIYKGWSWGAHYISVASVGEVKSRGFLKMFAQSVNSIFLRHVFTA